MEIKRNFQQNDCVTFSSEAETDKNLTTAAVHVIVHMCYTGICHLVQFHIPGVTISISYHQGAE